MTGQTYEARVWAMPADPGPTVTLLRDDTGREWVRANNGQSPMWRQLHISSHRRWTRPDLLADCGPLTDATPEVQP